MFKSFQNEIDLIGDVHGHYDELRRLLEKMGYSLQQNGLNHRENRKVGFLGDFINRGPNPVKVLSLVKSLCESGDAVAVLGNHEFSLIQNSVTGKKIPSELGSFLPWLRTLPLFLDLDTLRMVHAAWHFSSIEMLLGNSVEDDSFIIETLKKKSRYKQAVMRILSGIKINIPTELNLKDRFGIRRPKGRLKWWKDLRGKPYNECFFSPMTPEVCEWGPSDQELTELEVYPKTEKPVFIGHYCLPPYVSKISGQVVCLDGCVTCDKTLWGYRYNRTQEISASNLVEANCAE
jgi:hypothetical protein